MVFLIVFVTTLILLSSNEAKDKIRKLFRKRMKALDTNDMMKLFNQSQKIAVKTKEDFEAQKSKIDVQEAEKAPSSPESQNDIVPAEIEPVEVAEEVPHDEIVKEEIPSQNGKRYQCSSGMVFFVKKLKIYQTKSSTKCEKNRWFSSLKLVLGLLRKKLIEFMITCSQ